MASLLTGIVSVRGVFVEAVYTYRFFARQYCQCSIVIEATHVLVAVSAFWAPEAFDRFVTGSVANWHCQYSWFCVEAVNTYRFSAGQYCQRSIVVEAVNTYWLRFWPFGLWPFGLSKLLIVLSTAPLLTGIVSIRGFVSKLYTRTGSSLASIVSAQS